MKAKDKIALLVSGKISLKEIQALEDQEAREEAEAKKLEDEKELQKEMDQADEPDYKALYEELKKQIKETEKNPEPEVDYKKLYEEESAKVTKLQQNNINKNLKNDEKIESAEDILIKAYSHS